MKRVLILIILIKFCSSVFSGPVSNDFAGKIAVQFFKVKLKVNNCKILPGKSLKTLNDSLPPYYIFNFSGGGWVIISGEESITPILAYNIDGVFDESNMNPSVKSWLSEISEQIQLVRNNSLIKNVINRSWTNYLNGNIFFSDNIVAPLLKCKWNQSQYYNYYCPQTNDAMSDYDGRVPAGCVAIAMGQIMKYYNYPPKGIGSNSYSLSGFGPLTANFDTSFFNWNQIPDSLLSYNNMTAKLIFDCGVSVNMSYAANGSSAYVNAIPPAMINNFGYLDSMKILSKPSDSIGNLLWIATIKNELENNRPVLYSGDNSYDGHAFVCDGYDNSFPSKFHINWGWSGVDDGYYEIGALDPVPSNSEYHYDSNNMIITHIKPALSLFGFKINNSNLQQFYNNDTVIQLSLSVLQGTAKKFILYKNNEVFDSITSAPYSFSISTSSFSNGQNTISILGTDGITSLLDSIQIYIMPKYWKLQDRIYNNTVEYISIVDSNTVWVTLTNNFFMSTSNGGISWDTGYISSPNNLLTLGNISGVSAQTAYASMYNPNGNVTGGQAIFRTNDNGQTWSPLSPDFSNSFPDWVYFFDSLNGICVGDPYNSSFTIYTTNNGGATWNLSQSPVTSSNEFGLLNDFAAYKNTIWFCSSIGKIYKSSDKGITWSVTDTSIFDQDYYFVALKDSLEGIAYIQYGDSTYLNRTFDAGKTWVKSPCNSIPGIITYIPGSDSIWLNVNNGTFISYDDAKSFKELDNLPLNNIQFSSNTKGWSSLYFQNDSTDALYKWVGTFENKNNIQLTFLVNDLKGNALTKVKLTINGLLDTIINGTFTINVINDGGLCTFSAVTNGFQHYNGQFVVKNDTTVKLYLKKALTATFVVNDIYNNSISGISLVCNDSIKKTNENGQTTFTNLESDQPYIYCATNGNEYIDYGTIYLNDSNINVYILLLPESYYQSNSFPVAVFPNPASNEIVISSPNSENEVRIFNSKGTMLMDIQNISQLAKIPVVDLPNGLYMVQIVNSLGNKIYKIIIMH